MACTSIPFLTIGALHVLAGASAAAKLPTGATMAFVTRSLTTVQTAVFQFASALDLNTQQAACNHSLKANHNLLLPKRVDKDTWTDGNRSVLVDLLPFVCNQFNGLKSFKSLIHFSVVYHSGAINTFLSLVWIKYTCKVTEHCPKRKSKFRANVFLIGLFLLQCRQTHRRSLFVNAMSLFQKCFSCNNIFVDAYDADEVV